MRTPAEFTRYPDALAAAAPFGPYRASIEEVVDGDTLYVLADLGFNSYRFLDIRVYGVNCPELFTGDEREAGAAARDYVRGLVADLGAACVIASEKWPRSFTRYVGSVTLADSSDLARRLLDSGHAVVDEG